MVGFGYRLIDTNHFKKSEIIIDYHELEVFRRHYIFIKYQYHLNKFLMQYIS